MASMLSGSQEAGQDRSKPAGGGSLESGIAYAKILIRPNVVGAILGRGGRSIRELAVRTRTRLRMSELDTSSRRGLGDGVRIVTLSGVLHSLWLAAEEICRKSFTAEGCHPVTDLNRIPVEFGGRLQSSAQNPLSGVEPPYGYYLIRLLIPDTSVPCILGPRGALHKDICAKSNSRISISSHESGVKERIVEVSGSTMQVLFGVKEVIKAMQNDRQLWSYMLPSLVPESKVYSHVMVVVHVEVAESSPDSFEAVVPTCSRCGIPPFAFRQVDSETVTVSLLESTRPGVLTLTGPLEAVHDCIARLGQGGLLNSILDTDAQPLIEVTKLLLLLQLLAIRSTASSAASAVELTLTDIAVERTVNDILTILLLTSRTVQWMESSKYELASLFQGVTVVLQDMLSLPELPISIRAILIPMKESGAPTTRRIQLLSIFGICADAALLRLSDILSDETQPLPSVLELTSLKNTLQWKLPPLEGQRRPRKRENEASDVLLVVPTLLYSVVQSTTKEATKYAKEVANDIRQAFLECMGPLEGNSKRVQVFLTGSKLSAGAEDTPCLSTIRDKFGELYYTEPVRCLLAHIEKVDRQRSDETPSGSSEELEKFIARKQSCLLKAADLAKCVVIIGAAPCWTQDPIVPALFDRPNLVVLWSARLLAREISPELCTRSSIVPYFHHYGPVAAVRSIATYIPDKTLAKSHQLDSQEVVLAFDPSDEVSLASVLDLQLKLKASHPDISVVLCSQSTLPLILKSSTASARTIALVVSLGYVAPKEFLSPGGVESGYLYVICCPAVFGHQPDLWCGFSENFTVGQIKSLETTPVVFLQLPGVVEAISSQSSNVEAVIDQLEASQGCAHQEGLLLACIANGAACIPAQRLPSVAALLRRCHVTIHWARAVTAIAACGAFDADTRKAFVTTVIGNEELPTILSQVDHEMTVFRLLLCLAPFPDLWPSVATPEWSALVARRRAIITECRSLRLRELAIELDLRICMSEHDATGAVEAARRLRMNQQLLREVDGWFKANGPSCSYGCGWRGSPLELPRHEGSVCHLRKVTCPLCFATGVFEDFSKTHVCPKSAVCCGRRGCFWTGPRDTLSEHKEKECDLRSVDCPHCGWAGAAWCTIDHNTRFHDGRRSAVIVTSSRVFTCRIDQPTLDIMDLAGPGGKGGPRPDAAAATTWSHSGTLMFVTLSRDGKRIDIFGPTRGLFTMPSSLHGQWFTCLAAWDKFICAATSGSSLILLEVSHEAGVEEVTCGSTEASSLHVLAMSRFYIVHVVPPFDGIKNISQRSPQLGGWLGGFAAAKLKGYAMLGKHIPQTTGSPARPHYQPHTLAMLGESQVVLTAKAQQLWIGDFTGNRLTTIQVTNRILCIAVARIDDVSFITAIGMDDGQVSVVEVDLTNGKHRVLGYGIHEDTVRDVALRGPKKGDTKRHCLLLAGTSEGDVVVWEVECPTTGEPSVGRLAALKVHGQVLTMQLDPRRMSSFFEQVVFLGTSSGVPQPGRRNVSSLVITLRTGRSILVDCGEGTQHQLMLSKVKLTKVDDIFITHLHGDHCYGIFGLLHSCCMGERTEPITVYGPRGIKTMIETVFALSGGWSGYELRVVELDPEQHSHFTINSGDVTVDACPLKHRLPTLGYVFTEPDKPGALNAALAAQMGARGPQFGELKEGRDVTLTDGTVIRAVHVLGKTTKGRTIAVLQDTCDSSEALPYLNQPDLLIHECTYHDKMREKAIEFGHSTAAMAGEFASLCGAKVLALTHFSPRYNDPDPNAVDSPSVSDLRDEAGTRAGPATEVFAAEDFMALTGPQFNRVAYDQRSRAAV
ncbi:Zinc phosphodiesterase ELAC protein 1 [Perkinsus chesapeaki]|uniref:Zinc phosphodiesterase ELAC protein 1 n=1 Tax=Perkinsus chesapeaki TaxID=330153 RepID=A0A7J6LL60_PERCH|nr:Zinc phosphodiesterase ELAC protein 1 [Perkinsus chesapeaki]